MDRVSMVTYLSFGSCGVFKLPMSLVGCFLVCFLFWGLWFLGGGFYCYFEWFFLASFYYFVFEVFY